MFTVLSVVYTQLRIVILHQVVISPEGAMYQHNDSSDNYVHFIYINVCFLPSEGHRLLEGDLLWNLF